MICSLGVDKLCILLGFNIVYGYLTWFCSYQEKVLVTDVLFEVEHAWGSIALFQRPSWTCLNIWIINLLISLQLNISNIFFLIDIVNHDHVIILRHRNQQFTLWAQLSYTLWMLLVLPYNMIRFHVKYIDGSRFFAKCYDIRGFLNGAHSCNSINTFIFVDYYAWLLGKAKKFKIITADIKNL